MELNRSTTETLQPAEYCSQALQAIEVSEARRKRRKRDTGPDVIGMDIKRDLLRKAAEEKPSAEEFEGWLMQQVANAPAGGPIRAMAIEIYADYENARAFQSFSNWLEEGAPTPRYGESKRS